MLIDISKDLKIGSIKVFKNSHNMGAAYTLKKCVDFTTANVVAWISADDTYVDPRKLEVDLNIISQGYDLIFSKNVVIGTSPENVEENVNIEQKWKKFLKFKKSFKLALLTFSNFLNGSSVVFKKDIYNRVGGFDPCMGNVDADFDLFTRMIILDAKLFLSDTTVFQRKHESRTSENIILMNIGINISRIKLVLLLRKFDMKLFEEFRMSLKNLLASSAHQSVLRRYEPFLCFIKMTKKCSVNIEKLAEEFAECAYFMINFNNLDEYISKAL